jgi:drug/metabolite transporter (DMT)-like permease
MEEASCSYGAFRYRSSFFVNFGVISSFSVTSPLIGTCLALAACLAWAIFVIVNGNVLKSNRINSVAWTAIIGIGAFLGSLALIPLALLDKGVAPLADMHALYYLISWCIVLAIFGSWGATFFWNIASKRISTAVLGQMIALETIFAAIFNLVWEHRMPTTFEWAGGLLVIVGVLFCLRVFEQRTLSTNLEKT